MNSQPRVTTEHSALLPDARLLTCCLALHREVMYEDGPDGLPVVSGLRMSRAGHERIVKADAYIAALDVPGAKKLIPQVPSQICCKSNSHCRGCHEPYVHATVCYGWS